ncbi:hypothetical protein IP84_06860 [beta proteobacterium AAP99]|nr:hypothetical protein IP84_06860 [beta proteobacterium AAP99]
MKPASDNTADARHAHWRDARILRAAMGFGLVCSSLCALADDKPNDGTDPTRPVRSATVSFEHLDLVSGFRSDTLFLSYVQPVGDAGTSLRLKLPYASNDFTRNTKYGLGDASLKVNKVVEVNPVWGAVASAEVVFDTASRPELGTGRDVLKLNAIYARFLKGGEIFAPALLHSVSIGGDSRRPKVNNTTLDLYYVPKFANPKVYMTVDPAWVHDWETRRGYGALAVTMGYKLGPMLGGQGQVFVKPSTSVGSNRPVKWGVELGFQVLAF